MNRTTSIVYIRIGQQVEYVRTGPLVVEDVTTGPQEEKDH